MEILIAALSLGILGSFHCVGMCGPIALSIPVLGNSIAAKSFSILVYNAGRVLTYGVLGALVGLIGQSIALAGYQQMLSIAAGVLMLLMIWLPNSSSSKKSINNFLLQHIGKIKNSFGLLFKNRSIKGLFVLGNVNGLLPCGLVYLAIAASVASGNIAKGILFMVLFGAGTIPAMFALSWAGSSIQLNVRNSMRKVVPYFATLIAVLFIIRGLGLGIPYISPKISDSGNKIEDCCVKE
jgi:sulfite exporter TauE/SafE